MRMCAAIASKEASAFYKPTLADPTNGGTLYTGLQHVFRTQDDYDYLLENLSPLIGFTPDTGHISAGGMDPLTILQGPRLPDPEELELRWVLEAGGSLFLRYGVPLG